jgi:small subunit ribosomal protein S17e
MGRIKTQLVKSVTSDIMDKHGKQFGTDFQENKDQLQEVADMPSKKMRNIIAGYITRLKKR